MAAIATDGIASHHRTLSYPSMSADALSLLGGLPHPINAWGTPTPWGVSRSSEEVIAAVSQALRTHVDMSALYDLAERTVCELSGADAACFTHCAAAALVLASAAALSGSDPRIAAALPRCAGRPVIVLQAEHAIDFGQPVVRTLALSGAEVLLLTGDAGERRMRVRALADGGRVRALVFVESQLVKSVPTLSREECATLARETNALLVVDAAAQDWRLADRVFIADADLTIFSAQKYLAAPTCGIIVGSARAIESCKLNQPGIGRPMKPTKEALSGLVAALSSRNWHALAQLRASNLARASAFAKQVHRSTGWVGEVCAAAEQGPYPRVLVNLGSVAFATKAAAWLRTLAPPVVVGTNALDVGKLSIELTHVDADEQNYLLDALQRLAQESSAQAENVCPPISN